ncbi:MAG: HEAT repeat domain-containing protein, partial [Planctomycetales bacterium]|nr:HEAT repeat domain-containing protein [Planctomycetales bacterium]
LFRSGLARAGPGDPAGAGAAAAAFAAALSDPDASVRLAAARACGRLGATGPTAAALRERLADAAEDPDVRGVAARSLAEGRDEAASAALAAAVRDGARGFPLWPLDEAALEALAKRRGTAVPADTGGLPAARRARLSAALELLAPTAAGEAPK